MEPGTHPEYKIAGEAALRVRLSLFASVCPGFPSRSRQSYREMACALRFETKDAARGVAEVRDWGALWEKGGKFLTPTLV